MRNLLKLFAGEFVSGIGDWLYLVALLVVYRESSDSFLLGVIGGAGIIGYIVLSVPAGIVVDRYDRRLVLIVTDVIRGATMIALAANTFLGGPVLVAGGWRSSPPASRSSFSRPWAPPCPPWRETSWSSDPPTASSRPCASSGGRRGSHGLPGGAVGVGGIVGAVASGPLVLRPNLGPVLLIGALILSAGYSASAAPLG